MKVLVTGATGAVGQYVLEALMATSHEVRVLALPDSLHRLNFRDRIEIVPGEFADAQAVREAVDGVELVYHAGLAGPPPAHPPEVFTAVNVDGTRNLLRAAVAAEVRRVVMCSSSHVYAPHRSPALWPVAEDAPRAARGGPLQVAHGESLIAAEDLVFEAAARDGLEYGVLRPTVVAGRVSPFIDDLVRAVTTRADRIEIERRIWDVMQWVHGTDVAAAALMVGEDPRARDRCFVVAGDETITAYDVLAMIWEFGNFGRDDNPFADLAARNNIGVKKFEPARLNALGWRPRVDVKRCLAEVLGRHEFYSSTSLKIPPELLD